MYNRGINNDLVTIPWENKLEGHAFHIYPILCGTFRNDLINYLNRHEIESAIHYPVSIDAQKAVTGCFDTIRSARIFSDSQLSLPLNPALSDAEVGYIIEIINRYGDNINE